MASLRATLGCGVAAATRPASLCKAAPRAAACRASSDLTQKRCMPCEEAPGAMQFTGMSLAFDRATAERMLAEVPGWQLVEDAQQRMRLRRRMRTKNFGKALDLFQRIGQVAEAEGHHPDLHLVGYNTVTVELWTHARDGLSENDYIVAAKINELDVGDLLSKKPLPPED